MSRVFSCEFCEICENIYFSRTTPVTDSKYVDYEWANGQVVI